MRKITRKGKTTMATTGQAMKRMSLERNDYEKEGDVGRGDDRECQDVNEEDNKMKTTMSTKVTKTMKDNDVGRETTWADSWG
jgi:hypothetical protein